MLDVPFPSRSFFEEEYFMLSRPFHLLAAIVLIACALAACGQPSNSTQLPEPTTEATPEVAQATVAATATLAPTHTPEPTSTPAPTETPEPTETATITPTPTPEPSPTPSELTEAQLAEIKPNEMGWVPVLEYHIIEGPDDVYRRSPESLRADLEWLYANGFYPIRMRDLTSGHIDVPAGRSPVVLTFDDSTIGQFRYLDDGTIDPDSAMGILLAFAEEHPDFPPVANFFVLIEVSEPSHMLFGQPELAQRKLQEIVEWGGEVGSHTYTHNRLDHLDAEQIQWQLAMSSQVIEEHIGNGYEVVSLCLPLGAYPDDESLLREGEAEGVSYHFTGALEVGGGPSHSPFSTEFDPYHVFRMQAIAGVFDYYFPFFEENPTVKFVSDGDPDTVTVPTEETLDDIQRGRFDESKVGERSVRRYERPRN
jgi:peptidoglycan/xylan/chitin deacetylase (PgdA/CDA1 family)